MKKIIKQLSVAILILLIFGNINLEVKGEEARKSNTLEMLAVALVIDTSGSMETTDPLKMRETAANIFIDLLSPEDNLSVISFSSEAIQVQPMANIGSVSKSALKESISGKLEANGDTDYQKAFQMAYEQLESFSDENVKKVIVFLTDGNPDPNPIRITEAGFMENYMSGFWDTIKTIGSRGYPVYSVGFGALDMVVMDRIALETQGESKVLGNSSEIAIEFFNILSHLKNRVSFVQETASLAGDKLVKFDMSQYTSQVTMTIANTSGDLNVELIPPDGVVQGNSVRIEKSVNYTLITLNQVDKELSGGWTLKLTGTTDINILGANDLFVKVWATKPIANTQHPIHDPIIVNAELTGDFSENIVVEGVLKVDGVQALNPIYLKKDGKVFVGQFDDTQTQGRYDIELRVKDGDSIISSTSTYVHVKVLPTLTTDLAQVENGFILGEKKSLTSSLELGTNKLTASQDFSIEYYKLNVKYQNAEEVVYPLLDDGNINAGDAKATDGNFTTNVIFEHEGTADLSLSVRGVYKGEIFILEKNLGQTHVYAPGVVNITMPNESIYALKGDVISIPLKIKSTSNFLEILKLSVPEEIGKVDFDKIRIESLEDRVFNIQLTLNENYKGNSLIIPIEIKAESPLITIENGNLDVKVEITTKISRFLAAVRDKSDILVPILGVLLIVPLIFFLIGLLLYSLRVKPANHVNAKLTYTKVDDDVDVYYYDDTTGVPLDTFKKNRVVVTFNPEKIAEADHFIENDKYSYDLIFEKNIEKYKFKFIEGYKSLKKKQNSRVYVKSTPPGIITFDGDISTKLELNEKVLFHSGGFLFRYESKEKFAEKENNPKDILEGKM
ncbi:MAG: VWA domain-containing protein [Clostridiaceae bacterium]